VSDFQSVALGFAAAAKGLQSLKQLIKGEDAQAQLSEVYGALLSSQAQALEVLANQRSMLDEIRSLKEELASLRAWDAEKGRYSLQQIGFSAFAYALKAADKGTEPPHWICAKCYSDGKKTILQHNGNLYLHEQSLVCVRCKSEVKTPSGTPAPAYV
jgi:hypothetical protein